MPTKRIVVLINDGAGAGAGEPDPATAVLEAFDEAAGRTGIRVDVVVRSVEPTALQGELRRIWAEEDPDAVAVGGGDGTIGCAAGAAAGAEWALGVLPMGTFNHFAKDLGLPNDLVDAATVVLTGVARPVDVAQVNDRVFVNNSVLGVYPQMVDLRDELRAGRGWGKVRAVPVAAGRALRDLPLHRLDLSGPAGFVRRRVRTPFLFVGNGLYRGDGAGTPVRDTLSDGVLGLTMIRAVSRWGLVKVGVAALIRGTGGTRDLEEVDLPKLTVDSRARRLRVAIDGEVAWMSAPLRYRVRPGAMRVLCPEPEPEPG